MIEMCGWCGQRPPDKYLRLWYEDSEDGCECWKCSANVCPVCYVEHCPESTEEVRWDVQWHLYDALRRYASSLAPLGEWAG